MKGGENVKKFWKKKKVKHKRSTVGLIIDMPLELFKEELVKQEVNVGTMRSLVIMLDTIYADLTVRKDSILELVLKKQRSKDDPEIKSALEGIYAEMTKIEEKVTYLKERVNELADVGLN